MLIGWGILPNIASNRSIRDDFRKFTQLFIRKIAYCSYNINALDSFAETLPIQTNLRSPPTVIGLN